MEHALSSLLCVFFVTIIHPSTYKQYLINMVYLKEQGTVFQSLTQQSG